MTRKPSLTKINPLEYKTDWPEKARLWGEWWESKSSSARALLGVTAPKNDFKISINLDKWQDIESRVRDPEFHLAVIEQRVKNTFYGGVAFPLACPHYMPAHMTAFLGGRPVNFKQATGLEEHEVPGYQPVINSPEDYKKIKLEKDNKWWQAMKSIIEKLSREGQWRWLTAIPDLGGAFTQLAMLRGYENLLLDTVENRREVTAALEKLQKIWLECYQELNSIISQNGQIGTTSWLPLWSPKKYAPLEADAAITLSPGDFESLILPEIEYLTSKIDHTIYHFDGREQQKFLDLILSLDQIQGVQWDPQIDFDESPLNSLEILQRVQQADKKLIIPMWNRAREVKEVLANLKSEGLVILTSTSNVKEARSLLKQFQSWISC